MRSAKTSSDRYVASEKMKDAAGKVFRDAKTGEYVSAKSAQKRRSDTTIVERIKR